jgi:DNA-binding MarR family transcriptional regulator
MGEVVPHRLEAQLRALGDELMRIGGRRSTHYPGSRLEVSAFRLLWVLTEGTPQTLRDLADRLQLDPSTVTRQVNAAIQHGLVERYAVPDSAARLLRPTEAGRAAYLHDAALRADAMGAALDDLGPDRVVRMIEDLRAFNDALDESLRRRPD